MRSGDLAGSIVRLQVHPEFVVQGERYDPSRLLVTDRVSVTSDGVVGRRGRSWVVDVHHGAFPGRAAGRPRPVSVGFSSAYAEMQRRFGDTAALGVAAENIIVGSDRLMSIDDLRAGLVVRRTDGEQLRLSDAMVASPCRQFTSYLMGLDHMGGEDEVGEDRRFLRNGMRGFIFTAGDTVEPFEISVGDDVYLG